MMRIGFTGDVSFSGIFSAPVFVERESFPIEIIRLLKNNDYNVFNIEGPLTKSDYSPKKGISLKSNPDHIQTLKKAKCNIFNLANNHIMDCGIAGLRDTIELAKNHNILYFGAGEKLYDAAEGILLSKNGISIGLIGLSHREGKLAGLNSSGIFSDHLEDIIRKRIMYYRQRVNWVIVNYHGGEEYSYIPMPKRRNKLLKYVEWGADIVIAHHPHVVQGFEQFEGKSIIYSLGNLIFDVKPLYAYDGTEESVVLTIEFEKDTYNLKTLFTKIDRTKGRLNTSSINNKFVPLDNRTISYEWCRDSYRVFFNGQDATAQPQQATEVKRRGWISLLKYLIRPRSYLNLFKVIKSTNVRPILLGALKYAVLKKIGYWK